MAKQRMDNAIVMNLCNAWLLAKTQNCKETERLYTCPIIFKQMANKYDRL